MTTNAWSRTALLVFAAVIAGACNGSVPAGLPPGTLEQLDRRSYSHRLHELAHHFPGQNRPGKMQMMVIGDRRFLFQLVFDDTSWNWLRARGEILDVTDPLHPRIVNERAFRSFSINLAWHAKSKRWILMASLTTFGGPSPWAPGLRGVQFLDVTDPEDVREISKYSTDGGDPGRFWQTGSGTHRDYWDGGRFAYLGAADEDARFPERDPAVDPYSRSLQIIDLEILDEPRVIGRWWVPGQKRSEEDARNEWRSKDDPLAYQTMHGPVYVPQRVEHGGRLAYGGWGAFGVLIHDISNPQAPRLVGHWDTPEYVPGPMMPHHTVDPTRVDRGFVVTSPESMRGECQETWHDSYVLDVTDPANIRALSTLPVPKPPAAAPYESFCAKRGRFGPHQAPHLKAPGRPHPNVTFYTYFNGGLQAFDLSDPRAPRISAWFVPSQNGEENDPESYERSADSVFVEWDRRLVWLATNNGLYLLESPDLGEPHLAAMRATEWSLDGLNDGHP